MPEDVVIITTASASLHASNGAERDVVALPLPHRWDRDFPRSTGTVTYTLQLPPARSSEPHALFFTRVGNQAQVRVGSTVVGSLGRLGDATSDAAKAPVWVDVPSNLLRADAPTPLTITATMQADRWGGLEPVVFGPAEAVRPLYRSNYQWRQTASVAIVIALAILGLLAGALWWQQRDPLYGMLALTAIFGTVRMGDRLLPEPPLPWPLWGAVTSVAFIVHLMLMARFAVAAVGADSRRMRAGFWAVLVAGSLAGAASFLLRLPVLWTIALGTLAAPGAAVLVCAVRTAWRTRSRQSLLLCAAGLIVIVVGLRDWLVVRLGLSSTPTFSLLPHAVFVFVLFMGWIAVDRYSQQAHAYAQLAHTLEERVAQREDELGASYRQLARQTEEQARLQERQRIMRDIHDGVGSHLVSLLTLARRGDVSSETLQQEINMALDELRVAVDSLQPVHGDLVTVLATMRYRLQPRLEAAGLQVHWDVDTLPPVPSLTPQRVMQIQRVLLEAFTNVLRHASASRIRVGARALEDPPRLLLEVEDNGRGFDAAAGPRGGQGVQSMRSRSEALGARLELHSAPGQGTRVALELPRD